MSIPFLHTPRSSVKNLEYYYRIEFGPYLKQNPTATSEKFYHFLLKTAEKYLSSDTTVLDAGCGLGRFTIDIANKQVKSVIGIDIVPSLIYEAAAIAGKHRNHILSYPRKGNYQFITADVLHLPFQEKSFSFISCINLIDRVKDPKQCVDELFRVLKSGGILFFTDPYDWDIAYTPNENQVENIRQLIDKSKFSVIFEEDNIPFNLYINSRRTTCYKNHLVILEKTS